MVGVVAIATYVVWTSTNQLLSNELPGMSYGKLFTVFVAINYLPVCRDDRIQMLVRQSI